MRWRANPLNFWGVSYVRCLEKCWHDNDHCKHRPQTVWSMEWFQRAKSSPIYNLLEVPSSVQHRPQTVWSMESFQREKSSPIYNLLEVCTSVQHRPQTALISAVIPAPIVIPNLQPTCSKYIRSYPCDPQFDALPAKRTIQAPWWWRANSPLNCVYLLNGDASVKISMCTSDSKAYSAGPICMYEEQISKHGA